MNLTDLKSEWTDTELFHKTVHEHFIEQVNADPVLKAHRDYVETNIWGFGERSFWWMWKLICDELPDEPKMLEIGCFRGATLSLWGVLNFKSKVFGITPLSTEGGMWESDYGADIQKIHDDFKISSPTICQRKSVHSDSVRFANWNKPYDIIYVDGAHDYETALFDLTTYAPMVKPGGFLVIDDCNCEMHMPWGFFQGIQSVTDAKLKWLEENGQDWEFYGSVVHISVYKRK